MWPLSILVKILHKQFSLLNNHSAKQAQALVKGACVCLLIGVAHVASVLVKRRCGLVNEIGSINVSAKKLNDFCVYRANGVSHVPVHSIPVKEA